MKVNLCVFLQACLLWFVPFSAWCEDWDGCADELDRLRRAARDANDVASTVKSKAQELEDCKRSKPNEDHCRSELSDYESALSNLESELDTVSRRVKSASSSCGFDLFTGKSTITKPRVSRSPQTLCDVYLSYKDKLSLEALLQACKKSMSEAECRKCLSK